MSSSDLMIHAQGLSKAYRVAQSNDAPTSLGELVSRRIRHPLRRRKHNVFWAVNDASFEINRGDVVGVIGRNGAGKSTLFKILSQITPPTRGGVDLYGRVGSLLEVGTGFSGDLTGRENIYLNGSILGMKRSEINARFDEIVEFSGVGAFLETPVKRYSSGMYVRLAFAVAAHLDPEILIVDEVLSVGDSEFQEKCLGRIREVAKSGRTVLFVSHNIAAVTQLCSRVLLLERGRVIFDGGVSGGVMAYLDGLNAPDEQQADDYCNRPGSGEYRFTRARATKRTFHPDEEKKIAFEITHVDRQVGRLHLSAHIIDAFGVTVAQCDSRLVGMSLPDCEKATGEMRIRLPWLKPGRYRIDLFICAMGIVDRFEQACVLEVSPLLPYPYTASDDALRSGLVLADFDWAADSRQDAPGPAEDLTHVEGIL